MNKKEALWIYIIVVMPMKKERGEEKMNYVYPTRSAFIIPHGKTLKKQINSDELKKQRILLKKCLNKKESSEGKRVYNIEIVEDE